MSAVSSAITTPVNTSNNTAPAPTQNTKQIQEEAIAKHQSEAVAARKSNLDIKA